MAQTVATLKSYWPDGKLHFVGVRGNDAATLTNHGISFSHVDSTAILHGAGVSGTNVVINSANKRFLNYYVENEATSGDNRGMYLRHTLSGAGSGGEALRAFQVVSDVACSTCHGIHASLGFATSGSVTGLGVAGRNTIHLPAGVMTGTVAAIQAEIWLDTATSEPPAATHALIRGVVGGDATLKANVNKLFLLDVTATDASSDVTHMVTTGCVDSTSDTEIKIVVGSTEYWLLATATPPSA